MASFIKLDKEGVIGPVLTVLTTYQHLNQDALEELVNIIETNRLKLAKDSPLEIVGKLELINILVSKGTSINDILQSNFFQSLLSKNFKENLHSILLENTVPNIFKIYELENIPDKEKIAEWLARLLQSYLTEEQIIQIDKSKIDANNEKIMEFRKEIGKLLYSECCSGKISKGEVEGLLSWFDMELYKNDKELLFLLGKCFCSFSKFHDDLKNLEQYCDGQFFPIFCETNSEEFFFNGQVNSVHKHIGNYLKLFSMAEHPEKLAVQVKSLIETNFIPKIYD